MRSLIAVGLLFGINMQSSHGQTTYLSKFLAEFNRIAPYTSAPGYFDFHSSDTSSPYNFAGDYLRLRENLYRPNRIAQLIKQGRPQSPNSNTPVSKVKTVTLPAPGFQQYFANRIFNGEFNWLREQTTENELMGPEGYKTIAQLYHIDPYFADLYIMYVFLANKYYGKDQLHSTTSMRIDKTTTVTQNGFVTDVIPKKGEPFWIDNTLEPMYTDLFNQCVKTNILMRNEYNFEPRLRELGKEMEIFIQHHTAASPETAQLLENMMRYYKGKKSIQEEVAETNKRYYDDRFFPPEFYEAYANNWQQYPGATIKKEWAGRTVTRKEVSILALEKMAQVAVQNRIPEKAVTKAIFEGRLNPDPLDLQLAFEGFCTHLQVADVPKSTIDHLKENHTMDAQDTIPNDIYLGAVYWQKRSEGWNKRFGSVQALTNVTTIFNRKNNVCNGNDIILRVLIRLGSYFEQDYGFTPKPEMTYEEALKLAESAGSSRRN